MEGRSAEEILAKQRQQQEILAKRRQQEKVPPLCRKHNVPCSLFKTNTNKNNNKDREFYNCAVNYKDCKSFKWADDWVVESANKQS